MAIIYSYPTVTPTSDDLILGTDINADGKPTKNFTIQSIVDIVQGGAAGLGAVIKINSSAKDPATAVNQSAIDFLNVSGTGTASFGALSDGTLQITGGNLTTTGTGSFSQVTGVLQTLAQPNVTSLGTLTSLTVNTSVTGTAVVTTLSAPGDNLKIASTKAIIDYIATKPNKETLAETLVAGQTTSGEDIIVSAGDDITFTDTSKIILGTGSDATIEHDGTDLKILNTEGKTTISNSSGDIDISATATAKKLNLNGKAGVELKFDGNKQFETILNGSIATGTFNATGLLTAQTNLWFKDKIGIGGAVAPNYGTAGQVLSSGGALADATWEDLTPLYTWIIEADSGTGQPYTVASGDTIDFVGGANINTSWINASKELKIDVTGVVQKGTGAATQVAYWTDADTIAGDAGMVYDAANDYLTLAGTVKSGTFTTTAGTATWTTTVLDGFTSITSDLFVGDATAATVPSSPPWPANPTANVQFQGNASSANVLKLVGAVSISQGAAPAVGAENTQGVSSVAGQTYTSGGNITIETTLASTVATAKRLTNLPTPTSTAIAASDTILAAMAKLQGQINGLAGSLAFEGTWDASAGTAPSASPLNGQFWIVSVAGNTDLDGITDWKVGDWAIYVDNGAGTDAWQKLDQSNEVLGSGTAQKMAMWSGTVGDASQTLATGLIEQNATNNLITIGNSGSLTVEGNTTLGDGDTDTVLAKGPVTLNKTLNIKEGIEVDGGAGTNGQVLTSGAGSGAVMSWTTPTTGTVESVTAGDGIVLTGDAVDPVVNIDYLGTDNAILSATDISSGTIETTDQIWFNDVNTGTVTNTVKYAPVSKLPFDNFGSWKLAGDSGLEIVGSGNTATIAGGTGITTAAASTDTVTVTLRYEDVNANPSTGALNFIDASGAAVAPHEDDYLIFSNQETTSVKNRVRRATIADIVDLGNENLTEVLSNGNTTGGTDIAVSAADDITFTDTSKALFGTGADLQIYHDGSNSHIDNSTGYLMMRSDTAIYLRSSTGNEQYITCSKGAQVELYYNDSKKFETTNTGVTVTGNVSASRGFFNAGTTNVVATFTSTDGTSTLQCIDGVGNVEFGASGDSFIVQPAGGVAQLTVGASSSTFAGNVEIDGNLTVDGNIIHGSGGGIFNGDQAITVAGGATLAFTLTRATTGTMVFDVWLTSETSTGTSVAKKYTVAHSYNTTPVYNKIIDTGPRGSADFTVAFADSNTGATGTSVVCNLTAVSDTQNIGYTVQVGHDSTNALTFTAAS